MFSIRRAARQKIYQKDAQGSAEHDAANHLTIGLAVCEQFHFY